jgi:hypothetical protein
MTRLVAMRAFLVGSCLLLGPAVSFDVTFLSTFITFLGVFSLIVASGLPILALLLGF